MPTSPSSIVQLCRALTLPDNTNEENLSSSIVALLTSAVSLDRDETQATLSQIAHEISKAGAASLLGPLDVLPVLLPCKDPSAGEILSLIGECGSAKEVVMAIQEALERIGTAAIEEEDGEENDDSPSAEARRSLSCQLMTLVELYSACIPRLRLRRKTPSETLKPLLMELESAIREVTTSSSIDEGRALMSAVAQLVVRLEAWTRSVLDSDASIDEVKEHLHSLLDRTIVCCERYNKSSLAQRTFESLFPQYTVHRAAKSGWEGGEEVMSAIVDAYSCIGIPKAALFSKPSLPAMIVYAHSEPGPLTNSQLEKTIPTLVSAIKTNSALDEALAILLHALQPHRTMPRSYLTEEVVHPLFPTLSALSSSHPDSLIRHQAFRTLSVLLSMCPPPLRMHLLGELAVDQDLPQMRVASVGLIKEAVLEGLAQPPHLFASPMFFDFFGPILFRPNPEDLLTDSKYSLEDFSESSEPARLVECLGTYYTILQRDRSNLTRMRDSDALKQVEMTLLTPLRWVLDRWAKQPASSYDRLLIGSLEISLERVDDAISKIKAR